LQYQPDTKAPTKVALTRVDSRQGWIVTVASLAILSVALGAPYVTIVALKAIAADFGGYRSTPSAAASLAMLGTGVGGLGMGWLAERIGVKRVVCLGACMVCAGLALSSLGEIWQLYVGHGLLIGLLGNGAINAPLYVYITRWFEARRGAALALLSGGQYVAGASLPPLFERAIAIYGWRQTMFTYGLVVAAVVVPLALLCLRPAPETGRAGDARQPGARRDKVLGLPSNLAFGLLAGAAFLCCVPMAMPASHLIALCGDLGFAPSHGPIMLTVLLASAFLSRQFWGWITDRVGGLTTVLVGSLAQATAISGFIVTQSEMGLLAVAAAFGLGFSGLIPAYIVAIRQLFPAHEASWRIPTLLLTGMSGMAAGSWLAGWLYDYFGYYAPAFATGLFFNLVNASLVAGLLLLWRRSQPRLAFS
jgi:MFS family permease